MPSDKNAVAFHAIGDLKDKRYEDKKSLRRRIKDDPLVPLGCALTTAVLLGGLMTFQRGQSKLGNKFMQARVLIQAATVFAVAGGATLTAGDKQERKSQKYEDRVEIKLRDQ